MLNAGNRCYVCFNAKDVELMRSDGVRRREFDQYLGPDLLDRKPAFDDMVQRARQLFVDDRPIADLLLDQRVATGIGNVYKSETLFVGRVHPQTPAAAVDDQELRGLFVHAARLLAANTRGGPRITRRAADEAGILWVYGRTQQPCLRCDTPILSARLGRQQRSTFWCPRCQRAPDSFACRCGREPTLTGLALLLHLDLAHRHAVDLCKDIGKRRVQVAAILDAAVLADQYQLARSGAFPVPAAAMWCTRRRSARHRVGRCRGTVRRRACGVRRHRRPALRWSAGSV